LLEKLDEINVRPGHFPAQHRRLGFIVSGWLCFQKGTSVCECEIFVDMKGMNS
jgi:hypothetical protein